MPPHGIGDLIATRAAVARSLRSPGEAMRLRLKAKRDYSTLGRIVLQRRRAQAARPT